MSWECGPPGDDPGQGGYQRLRRGFRSSAMIRFFAALDSAGHAAIIATKSESVESASDCASPLGKVSVSPPNSHGVRIFVRPFRRFMPDTQQPAIAGPWTAGSAVAHRK